MVVIAALAKVRGAVIVEGGDGDEDDAGPSLAINWDADGSMLLCARLPLLLLCPLLLNHHY